MKKIFIATVILSGVFSKTWAQSSPNIFQGHWAWSCQDDRGINQLEVAYVFDENGSKILEESVGPYKVITNGEQIDENDIGLEVFDVIPSQISEETSLTAKLTLSLSDYSDRLGWIIYLQAGNPNSTSDAEPEYTATVISTFHSTDGDELVHANLHNYKCTASFVKLIVKLKNKFRTYIADKNAH